MQISCSIMEVPEVAVTESEQEIGPNETSQNAPDNSSKASKAENAENQDSEPTDLEESKEHEGPEVNEDPKELRDSTMEKNGQPWHRKLLSFFASYFGLFLIFALYAAGGAFYFHQREGNFEDEKYQEMLSDHDNLIESSKYLSEYLSDILYDGKGGYHNCTALTEDPCYQENIQDYRKSCSPTLQCENSDFCHCVQLFMATFEMDAKASIEKFVEQTVRVASNYDYQLNENGTVVWFPVWTFANSLLFCMTTLTLIGYGHISPSDVNGQIACVLYTTLGLPIILIFLGKIGVVMAKSLKYIYSRGCCRWCRARRKLTEFLVKKEAKLDFQLKDEEVGQEEYMPTDFIAVPIVVTLVVMAIYLIIGAVIYQSWEGWSILDSFYFAFVTLTTLGFGDMVPGQSRDGSVSDTTKMLELIFTTFYCLIGLALISMGISLMQEQVTAKAKWVAGELGMVETEEDRIQRYIMTKFPDARFTPAGKGGIQLEFGAAKKELYVDETYVNGELQESDSSSSDSESSNESLQNE